MNYGMRFIRGRGGGNPNGGIIVRLRSALAEPRALKNVHENIKPYKCVACDKMFKCNAYLQTHFKTVHKKIKEYKCDSCDKMFGVKSNLKEHFKNVHAKVKT